ncbi:hypothetical protein TpMuguga_03g00218 [Theileria parva strain Muguga]|uniref:Uncharacterized protein n=1 Tax=Theileria parva TaxID=5875 RepID=Q4MZ85_THEPA|nr:uncharacterized protein TpMuguga_03g00218 [Theileria parva strain Muguga]EAN30953.1 hypothetical protein TpMuguga_03g00218 [Theileria parva strain Muguga]|eukprot:XP_763236.1 hypothetical protein [Theileria parva strain Muguga]
MKFGILIFIAVLGSCPYYSVHGGCCGGKSTETTDGTAVTLDIKKTSSTNAFECSEKNDIRTYTPKNNKLFSKIVKGNSEIWTAHPNDQAVKVVIKVQNNNEKHLAILLNTLKFVLLEKDGNNLKDVTSKKHDVSKLKFFGDNDKELTTSDYKIDLVKLSYTVIFNDNVKCKKIMLGDKDLWKSTDFSNFETFKELLLGLISNDFFLRKSEKEFKKIEFKHSTTTTTTPTGTGQTTTTPTGQTTTTPTGQTGTTPASGGQGGTTQGTPTPATPAGQTGTGTRSTPATTTPASTTT